MGSLNTVHQSRCSEAVELTALFPCSTHLSATVVGGVLKSGPSMHPLTSNPKKMTRSGFQQRDIFVRRAITNLKLSPLIATLTHRCIAGETIRCPVKIVTVIPLPPPTIGGIYS